MSDAELYDLRIRILEQASAEHTRDIEALCADLLRTRDHKARLLFALKRMQEVLESPALDERPGLARMELLAEAKVVLQMVTP